MTPTRLLVFLFGLWGALIVALACGLQWLNGWVPCWFVWAGFPLNGPLFGPGTPGALARAVGLVLMLIFPFTAGCGAGVSILGWLGFRSTDALEKTGLSFPLGIAMAGTILLGLGLAGLFYPVLVVFLFTAGVWMALKAGVFPGWKKAIASVKRPPIWLLIPLAYLVIQVAPYWFLPETDQDAFVFHLALSKRFLETHKIFSATLTSGISAFFPMAADLPQVLALITGNDSLARLVHALHFACGLALVYGFVRHRAGEIPAWVAVIICSGSQLVFATVIRSKNDFAVTTLIVGAFISVIGRGRANLLAGSALMGFALGIKYTAFIPALAWIAAILIPATLIGRRGVTVFTKAVFLMTIPLVPWMARNWLAAGDPFYPLLSPRWFTGLNWSEVNNVLESALMRFQSYAPGGYGYSSYIPNAVNHLVPDLPGLMLLLPAVLFMEKSLRVMTLILLVGYILQLNVSHVPRYTFPFTWMLASTLCAGFPPTSGKMRKLLAGAVFLTVCARLYPPMSDHLRFDDRVWQGNPWPFLMGGQSRSDYLDSRLTGYWDLIGATNDGISPGKQVVMLNDCRDYLLPRRGIRGSAEGETPTLWYFARESWNADEFAKRMRQINAGGISENLNIAFGYYAAAHPFNWDKRQLSLYREYARGHLELVHYPRRMDEINGGYALYRVKSHNEPAGSGANKLPTLPGTDAIFSGPVVMFFAVLEGRVPRKDIGIVEETLLGYTRLMPGIGMPCARLANFYFRTRRLEAADKWYEKAVENGYITKETLVRWSLCGLPPEATVILQGRARQMTGGYSDKLLAEEKGFLAGEGE